MIQTSTRRSAATTPRAPTASATPNEANRRSAPPWPPARLFPTLVAALVVLGLAQPAQAFVCSRVVDSSGAETGPSLSWATRAVGFALAAEGTADLAGTEEYDVFRSSFEVWEQLDLAPGAVCASPAAVTDVAFHEGTAPSAVDRVGYDFLAPDDNENLLIFRDSEWPHAGQGGVIIALTTTTYNAVTGEILDADIEFNSAGFQFTSTLTGAKTDLMNTAVHEIGHLLGLGHSSVSDSTMFARADLGETEKRDLACDDRAAILLKYPASASNGYCDPPTAACGNCAPPGELKYTTKIRDKDPSADGDSGCTATTPALMSSVLALAGLGVRATRRRKDRCVAT